MRQDPETQLEHAGDELEERIDRLEGHIKEAEGKAAAQAEESEPMDAVSGDWEDTDDQAGGQDATAAGDDT
jgi:hypothetical protein